MIICLGQFQFVQVHTLIKSTLLSLSKVWTNCMITPFELSIRTHFSHLTHQMKSSIWFLKTLFPGNSGVVQVVETLLLLQEVWIPSLVRELDPTGNPPPPFPTTHPTKRPSFPLPKIKKVRLGQRFSARSGYTEKPSWSFQVSELCETEARPGPLIGWLFWHSQLQLTSPGSGLGMKAWDGLLSSVSMVVLVLITQVVSDSLWPHGL